MLSFLFWNINNKNLSQQISNIVLENNIDVLVLAECMIAPHELLNLLNPKDENEYFYNKNIGCDKFDVYTKFSNNFLQPKEERTRLSIRQLSLPGRPSLLLAIIHYQSKMYYTPSEQTSHIKEYLNIVELVEEDVGHERTIFFGDFNMNPFEEGLVSSDFLHATMCKSIAKKRKRVVDELEYPFFYNPMWNLFGDFRDGPPGTYYFQGSTPLVYFWHIFDQVLIRPDLVDYFNNEGLKIITSCGDGVKLINDNGIPNSSLFSDHLPLLFSLNL